MFRFQFRDSLEKELTEVSRSPHVKAMLFYSGFRTCSFELMEVVIWTIIAPFLTINFIIFIENVNFIFLKKT